MTLSITVSSSSKQGEAKRIERDSNDNRSTKDFFTLSVYSFFRFGQYKDCRCSARIRYMTKTILWYDLETFGLNPHYDRIAQAAALRTDMDLNVIDKPILLYSKLSPDYLPVPSSCMVTGITPQKVNETGINEADMIGKLVEEMMKPGTITTGYNSIGFDDECIRSTLYRNLYDPFEREYTNLCSRFDIINLVRATRDLRPQGMVFEKKNEAGFTSFRLTDLTEENNIDQTGAHDALVDVRATISIARLIKKNQPKLWQWALDHRDKDSVKSVIDVMGHKPLLHTSTLFASEKGNTRPVLPLFYSGKNEIWCFDLTRDIPSNPVLGNYDETGIFRLSANKCPFVAPLSTLDSEAEKRLGFTREEAQRKARYVLDRNVFIKEDLLETLPEYENSEKDPDVTLYGSFLSRDDKKRLQEIRKLPPRSKRGHSPQIPFDDEKYHKLVWRHVARNWPETLTDEERKKWKNWCASRLLSPPVQNAQSLENYRNSCRTLLESMETDGEKKKILLSLIEYGDYLEDTVIKD